jgi:hypothetical protein
MCDRHEDMCCLTHDCKTWVRFFERKRTCTRGQSPTCIGTVTAGGMFFAQHCGLLVHRYIILRTLKKVLFQLESFCLFFTSLPLCNNVLVTSNATASTSNQAVRRAESVVTTYRYCFHGSRSRLPEVPVVYCYKEAEGKS